jgi:hypothetical protein
VKTSLFKIWVEQAVYGSFPFWRRGYGILAHSAGCRLEWLADLRNTCQRFGEPPAGSLEAPGLFALRLRSGPWLIAGVYPLGCDDHGRPGALAFHAVFVGRWAYRLAGSNPFAFAEALRCDWSAADQNRSLPPICVPLNRTRPRAVDDARSSAIVSALSAGSRVVVHSLEPVDSLVQRVWRLLPHHVRRRASVATWAFSNANEFDLVALPKAEGRQFDGGDMIVASDHAGRS